MARIGMIKVIKRIKKGRSKEIWKDKSSQKDKKIGSNTRYRGMEIRNMYR